MISDYKFLHLFYLNEAIASCNKIEACTNQVNAVASKVLMSTYSMYTFNRLGFMNSFNL